MNIRALAASAVILLLLAACGGAEDPAPALAEDEAAPVELEALVTQVVMAEAFRIDASPLPPPIGEQALEGTVVFKFVSVAAGLSIKDETIPVVSVTYWNRRTGPNPAGNMKGDDHVAKGVYLAVTYSITNEATTTIRPDIHVAGAFSLADDKGRLYPVASYSTHHFPVSTAFAIQDDNDDPREWLEPGDTITTVMAFDVAEDAGEVRLRSEVLGIELPLGSLASALP